MMSYGSAISEVLDDNPDRHYYHGSLYDMEKIKEVFGKPLVATDDVQSHLYDLWCNWCDEGLTLRLSEHMRSGKNRVANRTRLHRDLVDQGYLYGFEFQFRGHRLGASNQEILAIIKLLGAAE